MATESSGQPPVGSAAASASGPDLGAELAPRRVSRCEVVDLRGLRCNVRHWGDPAAPALFMLHGWMDASATFQFVVDALQVEWHVIAPDWRGYGASDYLQRPYWFPEYYADLDVLLDRYSPAAPANLVGHSMGGAIASIYAAARPQRVNALAMLDFLGLKASTPDEAPDKIGDWLSAVNGDPAEHRLRGYRDAEALARRLQQANPRLRADRADFLAQHTARRRSDGLIELACDPWHKIASPFPYRVDEVLACWRQVSAPVLMVIAEHGYVEQRFGQDAPELARRLACFAELETVRIGDAGHNLQHDQPAAVAAAIERFFLPRRA
ncbi:MAG TPA: alpha/beta hydrolase [Rhodocyclaceae bacterium]|nr:alpha/beta hydrolase [Rhodocyclaceae bacterium]